MITAIDTNILLDVLTGDEQYSSSSFENLLKADEEGSLVICELVFSEMAAAFNGSAEKLEEFLGDARIKLVSSTKDSLILAGQMWRKYRDHGGSRQRIVSDFFIGAHAMLQADYLLTRDRGFYRQYFSQVKMFNP